MSDQQAQPSQQEPSQQTTTGSENTEQDLLEVAKNLYELYGQPFMNLVDGMGSKDAKRLAKALVLYPFIQKNYLSGSLDNKLRDAYQIGDRLLQAKSLIMLHTAAQSEQTQQQTNGDSNEQSK